MKKFFVSLAVVCMISLLAVSAFAYDSHPVADMVSGVAISEDSTKMVITLTEKMNAWRGGGLRVSVFEEKPELTDQNLFWAIFGGSYKEGAQTITVDRLVYSDNAPVSAENTVELVLEGEKKFEKNKTYYIGLCPLDGAGNWTFSETLYEFTYTEGQKPTADFSVIAYAVAAITGCGALVIAKKRG